MRWHAPWFGAARRCELERLEVRTAPRTPWRHARSEKPTATERGLARLDVVAVGVGEVEDVTGGGGGDESAVHGGSLAEQGELFGCIIAKLGQHNRIAMRSFYHANI